MQEVPFASFFEEDDLFEQSMTEDFFQGQSNSSFISVADQGCLSRIRIFSILDPHQRI